MPTYSFGVAFHGCTLPGADKPLFTVDEGHMDFGLGIHGEPGITSAPWMPARTWLHKLVETVLPSAGGTAGGLPYSSTGLAPPSMRNCSSCTATSASSSRRRAS